MPPSNERRHDNAAIARALRHRAAKNSVHVQRRNVTSLHAIELERKFPALYDHEFIIPHHLQ